jgi:hypothetical protein
MEGIGRNILRESKAKMAESGSFEQSRSRDLLSLLLRANTAKDISASQRLSDEEVLARMSFSFGSRGRTLVLTIGQRFRHSWSLGTRYVNSVSL